MASGAVFRAILERRAGTVLRQTRELATLCATPACVVIHNPDDVSGRPWRMWPESAAEVRDVVELYMAIAGSQRVGVDAVSGGGDGMGDMTEEEAAEDVLAGVDGRIGEVQAMIDLTIIRHQQNKNAMVTPPAAATAVEERRQQNKNLIVTPPAAAAAAQPVEERAMVEGINILYSNAFDDPQEEEEAFDITELIEFSALLESVGDDLEQALRDDSGPYCFKEVSVNVANEGQQHADQFGAEARGCSNSNSETLLYEFVQEEIRADEGVSSSISSVLVGGKRKVPPEMVSSFSELVSRSSQRRKLIHN